MHTKCVVIKRKQVTRWMEKEPKEAKRHPLIGSNERKGFRSVDSLRWPLFRSTDERTACRAGSLSASVLAHPDYNCQYRFTSKTMCGHIQCTCCTATSDQSLVDRKTADCFKTTVGECGRLSRGHFMDRIINKKIIKNFSSCITWSRRKQIKKWLEPFGLEAGIMPKFSFEWLGHQKLVR